MTLMTHQERIARIAAALSKAEVSADLATAVALAQYAAATAARATVGDAGEETRFQSFVRETIELSFRKARAR